MFEIQANEVMIVKDPSGAEIPMDPHEVYWKIVAWEETHSATETMDLLKTEIGQPTMMTSYVTQIYWEIIRVAMVREDEAKKKIEMTRGSIVNSQDSIQGYQHPISNGVPDQKIPGSTISR